MSVRLFFLKKYWVSQVTVSAPYDTKIAKYQSSQTPFFPYRVGPRHVEAFSFQGNKGRKDLSLAAALSSSIGLGLSEKLAVNF